MLVPIPPPPPGAPMAGVKELAIPAGLGVAALAVAGYFLLR